MANLIRQFGAMSGDHKQVTFEPSIGSDQSVHLLKYDVHVKLHCDFSCQRLGRLVSCIGGSVLLLDSKGILFVLSFLGSETIFVRFAL